MSAPVSDANLKPSDSRAMVSTPEPCGNIAVVVDDMNGDFVPRDAAIPAGANHLGSSSAAPIGFMAFGITIAMLGMILETDRDHSPPRVAIEATTMFLLLGPSSRARRPYRPGRQHLDSCQCPNY